MADPADQFPKAVGTTLIVPAAEKDQLSPVPTNISLEPPPKSPIGTIHEGETLEERKNIMRPVDRGPSGEKLDLPDANNTPRSVKSKRRTQFYDGQFSDKDATGTARDRVVKDSPVVAELKTNVIVRAKSHIFLSRRIASDALADQGRVHIGHRSFLATLPAFPKTRIQHHD